MISLALFVLLGASAEVDPALLQKLAEHDARMEKFAAAHELSIDAVVRDLDGDGKVIHTTTSKLKQKRVGGKLKTTVLSASKDGADVKKKEQEAADERDAKDEKVESPFEAATQTSYLFKALGPEKAGSSNVLISFAPKDPGAKGALEGVAVVDPEAGELVQLAMKPSKLPMFADSMRIDLEYQQQTEAGRAVSKYVLAGAGGILFIKRRGDLTMTFSFAE
ncbi:MAG: hypothetical protein IPJ65_23015 [Archangiaceae bacterium]|nr:hypothetical protein [Archangiaceae bacterium]